jgi:hypothetical protein
MALKKSELYSSLWKSCDELRGGMDASQYKDYVLVLLFVKYVSDKYAGQTLTGRIKQLAERYAAPLPKLAQEVQALSARLDEHLKKMGFAWN